MSQQNLRVMVTGGSGFIGSAVCRHLAGQNDVAILNFDKLTYAGNLHNLASVEGDARYTFVHGDICDRALVDQLIAQHQPRARQPQRPEFCRRL